LCGLHHGAGEYAKPLPQKTFLHIHTVRITRRIRESSIRREQIVLLSTRKSPYIRSYVLAVAHSQGWHRTD
jgi:hypothetical protein